MFGGSASSSATNVTHSDATSMMSMRKKSRESDMHTDQSGDMLHADDSLTKLGTNERKKSGGSSHSKGKDREKSESSLLFQRDEGKRDKVQLMRIYTHNAM